MRQGIIACVTAGVLFLLSALVPALTAGMVKALPKEASFVQETTSPSGAHLVRSTELTENPEDSEAVNSHVTWEVNGQVVLEEFVPLIRESSFPVLNNADGRLGLSSFFPVDTERRSYLVLDPNSGEESPADYLRQDGQYLVFQQPASGAELTVEPRTGTIIQQRLTLAGQEFTLQASSWSVERMNRHLAALQASRIFGFVAKYAGFAALIGGLWLLARPKRS